LWEDPTKKPHPFLERVRMSKNEREEALYGPHWKEKLVQLSRVPISRSPTGAPIMLMGRTWYHQHATTKKKNGTPTEHREVATSEDKDSDDDDDDDDEDNDDAIAVDTDLHKNNNNTVNNAAPYHNFHPVLHRSPQNVPNIQGRILMW